SVWNLRRLRSWIGRRRGTRMSGSSVVPAGSSESPGPPGGPVASEVMGRSALRARGELHAAELGDQGDVPLGADVVAGQRQVAVRLDVEGRAGHAHGGLAVVLLLAERPPLGEHLLVRGGQQWKGDLVLVAEAGELVRLVGGDT